MLEAIFHGPRRALEFLFGAHRGRCWYCGETCAPDKSRCDDFDTCRERGGDNWDM
jgi:hypothetical protein